MKLYFTLLFCAFSISGFSQASFQFIPEIYGRTLDGLFNCRISEPGSGRRASLKVTVSERIAGTVCVIKTEPFAVLPGTNPIPPSAVRSAAVQFANNRLGQLTGASKYFPEGDYDYCFELTFIGSDNPPDEQCFSYVLAPFADMNLIDPYDKEKICDKRPLLTWQPLIPTVPGALYQLVLTEIKDSQTATEAINYNLAMVNQSGILSPVLPYPPIARELENNKKYAWQVTAYKDQTILNRSEIWEFTLECRDSVKKNPFDGYRNIADLAQGNFYLAAGEVRFELINAYQAQDLKFTIRPVLHPEEEIRGMPTIKLVNGRNLIVIDLEKSGSFTINENYLLEVTMPDGDVKSLRFTYQQKQ